MHFIRFLSVKCFLSIFIIKDFRLGFRVFKVLELRVFLNVGFFKGGGGFGCLRLM